MAVTQENRRIQVVTSLGEDVLLFYKMNGWESLSEPFEFNIELLSENPAINPNEILGTNISICIDLPDGSQRYFNGCVTRFGQYGNLNVYTYYRATVRPWLWFLTRASNCRIFQNKTAPEIIKQVFQDQGFSDFKLKLSGSYAQREYCVQYRETDFNFVSRLMEEEGIHYYFTHEKSIHHLVLADSSSAHDSFPGYEKIPYHSESSSSDKSRIDHISDWGFAHEVQPGAYEITDYDFKKPKAKLLVKSTLKEAHSTHAAHEFFDYPGRYVETSAGEHFVHQRIEEHHARFEQCEGKGNARGLAVGYLFKLDEFHRPDQNREYLVLSANYHLFLDDYLSGSSSSNEDFFSCTFAALDNQRPFRPLRNTPKPLVHGAQTAVVVGPDGEEIYTDKYGRVKVHFHWDRKERWKPGKQDQDSSCWVRVAHPWAGKNWGMVAIPRMGHEVLVEFLEGDPDQPLIVGSVYNADNMPPYELPANMTQSGIKSRSSKGGATANFNEFRFEDKKGSEQVFLHAEKNQDIEVENNETHWVGHDRTKTIDHDETTHVKHDRTETVDNNETITIGVNRVESVGSNETISIGANRTETVGSNETITVALTRTRAVGVNEAIAIGAAQEIAVGAARTLAVGANQSTTIGNSHTVDVGNNQSTTVGKNQTSSVGENRSASVGKDDSLTVGKNLTINAGDSITIKTGSASITMKKDGTITITGKDITIKGSGAVNVKADKDVVMKGKNVLQN
ncbi:MAG: type VI secretion system tip protein TssI/VgrG [Methylococcales bacterium]|nr:type VI secretion system tip protein VgrG [Methylococcaceae bacterium]